MTGQLDLFQGVELAEPKPRTTVNLGRKTAQVPLLKKQPAAVKRLMEILKEQEGKDIFLGSYSAGGGHFWLDNLKLSKLRVEGFRLNETKHARRASSFYVAAKELASDIRRGLAGRAGARIRGLLSLSVGLLERLRAKPDQ